MDVPLASVVVLGYNGLPYLDGCLGSVLDQDLPRSQYEVLYVDNGSRDGSAPYVRERFSGVRVLELDRNYGYAEGNNIGYRHTRGAFVAFLNQDTVVHRGWLRELAEGLTSSPGIMAGHSNIIQPWYPEFAAAESRADPGAAYTAEVSRLGYIRYRRLPATEEPVDTLFLHGVSLMIRRELADMLGYIFDPDFFAYAEDLDLGLRVRSLGYRTVVVPRSVVYHLHTLHTRLRPETFVRTVRIVRNRYLSFFKAMTVPEFLLALPLITLGGPWNATEFGLSPPQRLLYGLFLVPVTVAALLAALYQIPSYATKRQEVLSRRSGGRFWCLRALWEPRPGRPVGGA